VEKTVTVTVEKPVEKIVEKVVPAKCPKPPECQKPQTTSGQQPQQPVIPPGSNITATTNAPDSAAVGVNTGTVTVNPPTNPNADVVVYDCIGRKTSMKHVGINLEFNMASADSPQQPYIDTMVKLANSGKSAELLEKCTERKNAEAGWLTPYLFCAVAQLGLGHMDEAKREFQYYDSRKGGSYEGDGLCSQLVNAVQARLK
jgi:hypothetical protein